MAAAKSLPRTVLVTGGAGYIGSHTVRLLLEAGEHVTILDDLRRGHAGSVPKHPKVNLVKADLGDPKAVGAIFRKFTVDAVVHFAAFTYVGESTQNPAMYYQNNTAAPLVLLEAMRAHGCKRFIFSSTAATYGNPQYVPMDEKHPQVPINPYGRSKLMLERILEDYDAAYGIRSVRLRYFNACGAWPDASIGEDHDPETHLIPLVLMAATGEKPAITVFGTDYDTPDGTCIRDYIHIVDLGKAHVKALGYLRSGGETRAFNLGTGRGHSVKEVIAACEGVVGRPIPVKYGERRAGDPASLVADPSAAHEALEWKAEYTDLSETVRMAWAWLTGPNKGRYAKPSAKKPAAKKAVKAGKAKKVVKKAAGKKAGVKKKR